VLPTPLPEPWWDVTGDDALETDVRRAYDDQLGRELSEGHALAGREPRTAAKCGGCDHVVVALNRDEWALLHLTWSSTAERPGRPMTIALGSWDAVYLAAAEHAATH
jgi:hypothetical protein